MMRPEPTLKAWEAYLLMQHPKEIDLGLHRIGELASRLGLHQFDCPVITVGGTNGKGSTVATLEAFYCASGTTVGVYTSPHLLSFTERIKINGIAVDEGRLVCALDWLYDFADEPLTFFEYTTLAALKLFKDENVSRVILEVGLGGRLDATNIVDADVAIITTVDFDHLDYLGETLEQIGYEKAGIMRAGRPVVFGDLNRPQSVFLHAKALGATLYSLGESYSIEPAHPTPMEAFRVTLPSQLTLDFEPTRLHPKSIAAALVALEALGDLNLLSYSALRAVVSQTTLMGRLMSVFDEGVEWLLDVAHNHQSVCLLRSHIEKIRHHRRVIAVFSALKDKEIDKIVTQMSDTVDAWYICELDSPRAITLDALNAQIAVKCAKPIYPIKAPLEAIHRADLASENDQLMVVFGSFLMVGSALHYLNAKLKESS